MILGNMPESKYFMLINGRWCLIEKLNDDSYYIYDLLNTDYNYNADYNYKKISPLVVSKKAFNRKYSNAPRKSVLEMCTGLINYFNRRCYDLSDRELLMFKKFLDCLNHLKKNALKNSSNPKYGYFKKKNLLIAINYYNNETEEARTRLRKSE